MKRGLTKLYIYRNLRTGGFSVRYKGRVIERIQEGTLERVTFKVNEAGRQRVLSERQKNVHSFIVGTSLRVHEAAGAVSEGLKEVQYNPYRQDCFTVDGNRIDRADKVLLKNGKCYLYGLIGGVNNG